ncbi:MAG: FAD:protein FMN transferase [Fimbriimonadaceae bacterium]|nr:FAD:protein FMN transferase [Fimbriimonadaceae bacterium]QYK56265.1 MAG: FAD:protein FMN transferase [Fimbriimonadaceae bacterium]
MEFTEVHMGCGTRIVAYGGSEETVREACSAAFSRIAELEDVASDHRPQSEARRVLASGSRQRVSRDLHRLLARSQQVWRLSGGLFDVTVGSVTAGGDGPVGFDLLGFDAELGTLKVQCPGVRLDFGGIAKGDAADQALLALARQGVESALVDCGGDIACGSPPPGAEGWSIELPDGRVLVLARAAVCTSGPFLPPSGRRHLLDPRAPEREAAARRVTVCGGTGLGAEPWATVASLSPSGSFTGEMEAEGVHVVYEESFTG